MLAEQLKADTLTNHQQLEKMLVSRMKAIRATTDYINLLQLFYSYFGGLEQLINRYVTDNELPDHAERRKSAALANDITALGGQPATIASGNDLPNITSIAQAFAALYVIEGSTLGGQIISQMMSRQLGLNGSQGLSFFNGYGENTGPMWEKFKNLLNAQATSPAQQNLIIETANETFAKFKQWVEKNT